MSEIDAPDDRQTDAPDDRRMDNPDDRQSDAHDERPAFEPPSEYRTKTLPADLRPPVTTAYGLDGEPATVGDWMAGLHRRLRKLEAGPLDFDDLCHLEGGGGRHVLRAGGATWEFHCVFDALLVQFVAGGPELPHTVESRPPDDGETSVTVEVGRGEATVTPADAVLSLGVARALADEPGAGLDPERAYGQVCAYWNAFPDRKTYEAWAGETDEAATIAVPLREAIGLARDLILGPPPRRY